jgi:PAS domain S-box-containing protein
MAQRDTVLRTVRDYRFWLVVALFVIGVILHYPQQMPLVGIEAPSSLLGLTRHTIERVYLLVPIIYASFVFGLKGGIGSLAAALAIMLPRAILLSSNPNEAVAESIGVIAIGTVVTLLFHMRRREQERIRLSDALLKAEDEKWRSSFNALEDVMLIIDRDYNIEDINDSGLALLGKTRDQVVGKKCYQILRGTKCPQEECPCRKTLETKQVGSLDHYEPRFGRYFSIKSSPIFDENGEIVKFVDLMRDITELKRAEELLAKIIDGSPISIFVIDRDHRVTHWNTALEALSRLKREEMVGSSEQWRAFYVEKRPVLADLIVDGASADEIERYYQGKCRKSPLIGGAYEVEDFYPALGSNGRWLHFTASPIRNLSGEIIASIETLQDVTERKRVEGALQESEQSYRELFEVALDAIWVNDTRGNILKANKATEKLTGLSGEELARSNIKTFLGEDGLRLAKDISRRFLKDETLTQPYEQHLTRSTGSLPEHCPRHQRAEAATGEPALLSPGDYPRPGRRAAAHRSGASRQHGADPHRPPPPAGEPARRQGGPAGKGGQGPVGLLRGNQRRGARGTPLQPRPETVHPRRPGPAAGPGVAHRRADQGIRGGNQPQGNRQRVPFLPGSGAGALPHCPGGAQEHSQALSGQQGRGQGRIR